MATHSSVLAWRIPGTAEPGGLLYGVAQSRTRLKRLSSSGSSRTLPDSLESDLLKVAKEGEIHYSQFERAAKCTQSSHQEGTNVLFVLFIVT